MAEMEPIVLPLGFVAGAGRVIGSLSTDGSRVVTQERGRDISLISVWDTKGREYAFFGVR